MRLQHPGAGTQSFGCCWGAPEAPQAWRVGDHSAASPHPAGEEGAPRAAAGAEQPWVIGSGRRWHGAAEKVITWDWEQNARSEGGAAPLAKVRALLGCRRCFWQGSALVACTEVPAGPARSGWAGSARSCQTCTDVSPRMCHQLLKAKPH